MLSLPMLNLFANDILEAFGRMLLHSLWLGMVFAILTGLVLILGGLAWLALGDRMRTRAQ